ncbi:MAG: nuclear transport factor 2 family protein [Candidatus Rokubacteria bacterium]|nr:nuclear transport factor 2 family protein [Candidatus Rokubacteria bacterium]
MGFDGEAFVKRFMEVWNAHDVNGIMAQMSDDVVFEPSFGPEPWGARYAGTHAVRAGVERNFQSIPDIRWDALRHVVCEDHAVVEWLTTGTPRDGKPFEVHGCDILTLRGGKISAKRSYRKSTL